MPTIGPVKKMTAGLKNRAGKSIFLTAVENKNALHISSPVITFWGSGERELPAHDEGSAGAGPDVDQLFDSPKVPIFSQRTTKMGLFLRF